MISFGSMTKFEFFLNCIYLAALGLSCSMWALVPWPGFEPWLPALGAQSLSHWTTRKVPEFFFLSRKISNKHRRIVNPHKLFCFFLIWLHQVSVAARVVFIASCRTFLIAVHILLTQLGFPCGLEGKASPARQETWVQSPGWEDPLEKEMATHFSTLAWKMPWTEEAGRLLSMGLQRVARNRATSQAQQLQHVGLAALQRAGS